MIRAFYIFLFIAFCNSSYSQTKISWEDLEIKKYSEVENPITHSIKSVPIFSEVCKKLDSSIVEISGYLVPLEPKKNTYLLITDTPKNSSICNPSPDEIIEIHSAKKIKIETEQSCTIQGQLQINSTDTFSLTYIIEEAKIIKK